MSARSLRPNAKTWSTVLSLCAKNEKSRKATAILFDWVQKFEAGEVEAPNLRTFNYCINVCEVCGETELTLAVLEKMKSIHETEGNVITFNIALKRLAKEGNWGGCEGIIIGMLKSQIEPSVVSYTTAIGACASAR
jgi:pentatricopeptide repeat domain-containing protein 1